MEELCTNLNTGLITACIACLVMPFFMAIVRSMCESEHPKVVFYSLLALGYAGYIVYDIYNVA